MNNKHQEEQITYSIIFGLLVAFSVFMLKQYFHASEKPFDLINAAIYFWTGVVLAIYTYETYNLRKEAQRQTELQLRPFVILDVDHDKTQSRGYKLQLKNLGNGTAVNIKIRDVEEESTQSIYRFTKIATILTAGECASIECQHAAVTHRGGENYEILILSLENLYLHHTKETTVITIEFKDIEGQLYVVKQTISRNDLNFDFAKG